MVSYCFQSRFAEAVRSGAKTQTIRKERKRPSRHAKPGERITLYDGHRGNAVLIGEAQCLSVTPIIIEAARVVEDPCPTTAPKIIQGTRALNAFARRDGFDSWELLRRWFVEQYGDGDFHGVLIAWELIR